MIADVTVPIIFAAGGVVALFLAICNRIEVRKVVIGPTNTWMRGLCATMGVVLIGIAIWLFGQSPVVIADNGFPPPPPPPVKVKSKYSFEDGPMGWIPQDYEDSMACAEVLQSDDRAKEGQHSLKMLMNLIGGDTAKSKGEAWVNMLDSPPKSVAIPVDLTNRKITAWVYAPPGSRGERSKPNGFQLFVKDENWNSEYGPWRNVAEGVWDDKISFTVSTSKPQNGHMDQGFDPKRVIAVGVKMGSGGGTKAEFDGAVWIDAIDW
jgi:hypothetical protein